MLKRCILITLTLLLFLSLNLFADHDFNPRNHVRSSREIMRDFSRNTRELALNEVIGQWAQYPDYENVEWFDDEKFTYSYDDLDRLGHYDMYYWDEYGMDWEHIFRGFIHRSPDGLIEGMTMMGDYHGNGELDEVMRLVQENNALGNISTAMMQFYDFHDEEWFTLNSLEFIYGDDDMITMLINSYHDFDELPEREYIVEVLHFTYDNNGRFVETLVTGSDDGENWYNLEFGTIEYHPNDYSTYSDLQAFFNHYSIMMSGAYTIGGVLPFMISEDTNYYWDDWDNEWIGDSKDVYTYNDHNLLTTLDYYYWDDEDWFLDSRELFTHDSDNMLTEMHSQWFHYWNEEWMDDYRKFFFYAETSSVDNITVSPQTISVVNYPNPFNPETTIKFSLTTAQKIELSVYNIVGQKVKTLINETKQAGEHQVVWNGTDDRGSKLPSGIYFYRMSGHDNVVRGKMMMLK